MRVAPNDPGATALRRAGRTAIVMPAVFALSLVVFDNPEMALFAGFGSFAMLSFADFGGPPHHRCFAYLAVTGIGCALAAAATPFSREPWLGAAVMFVVGSLLVFGGVLGGYASAGSSTAVLAFLLALTMPGDVGDIPARVAGWALAGAVSTIAALVLWPQHEGHVLRRHARATAEALRGLLTAIAAEPADAACIESARRVAARAMANLDEVAREVPNRPIGPTSRVQAAAFLVNELRRLQELGDELARADRRPELTGANRVLLLAAAALLNDLAATQPSDLVAFEHRFEAHRVTTEHNLAVAVGEARDSGFLQDRLDDAFRVRAIASVALSAAANATVMRGGGLPDTTWWSAPVVPPLDTRGAMQQYAAMIRAQMRSDSVWFRSGVRAGIGLAVAVLVVGLADLSHGFWVALATFSVLKSNAVGTRHTAAQALVGTTAGFLVASALTVVIGTDRAALWIALPVCVFLTVYTPTAVRFVVGQAMFTVMVVVLFNLVTPEGWRVAAARIEDIAVGTATAFVVGVLLWPRGAGSALRTSLAALFDASGTYVRRAIGTILGRAPLRASDTADEGLEAHAAFDRANDAFATLLDERGPKRVPTSAWAQLMTAGETLPVAGDALVALAESRGPVEGFRDEVGRLDAVAGEVEQALRAVGRSLDGQTIELDSLADTRCRRAELTAIARDALAQLDGSAAPERVEGALRITWTADRIAAVDRVVEGLQVPLREAGGPQPKWWR